MFKIVDESVIKGDLFNAHEELKVVTINTVGAMGRGIALSTKVRWPEAYTIYRERYLSGALSLTEVWDIKLEGVDPINIAMFPTKEHWRRPAHVPAILHNCGALKQLMINGGYTSVAVPPLGMVNGWLRADDTFRKIIMALRSEFKDSELTATLYCPSDIYTHLKKIFSVS